MKNNFTQKNDQAGFTLVELLTVITIILLITGYTALNLFKARTTTTLRESVDTVVSDINQQQTKAMTSDTEGRGMNDNYGINFGTTSYTLFHGTTYNSADTTNFTINLNSNLQFSNDLFSSSTIVFLKGSGEMNNFTNGSNTITIKDTQSGSIKTVTVNRYGLITQIN